MAVNESIGELANYRLPTSDSIRLSALLLSENDQLICAIRELALMMALRVDLCSDLLQATRKIATTKYEGVLVDYSNELRASALINGIRCSTSNASDVVFVFVKDANQAVSARQLGANFIMEQPFTVESVAPYIRAGYGLMIHELWRYFRARVVFPVDLVASNGRRWEAKSIDLSSGGLAVQSPQPLIAGQTLNASFKIPGSNKAIDVKVMVCWTDKTCRAGLRFEMPSQFTQGTIRRWIRAQIDQGLSPKYSCSPLT